MGATVPSWFDPFFFSLFSYSQESQHILFSTWWANYKISEYRQGPRCENLEKEAHMYNGWVKGEGHVVG